MVQVQRVWNDTMKCRTKGRIVKMSDMLAAPNQVAWRALKISCRHVVSSVKFSSVRWIPCAGFACSTASAWVLSAFSAFRLQSKKHAPEANWSLWRDPCADKLQVAEKKRLFVSDPTESVLTVQRQTNQRLATGGGVRKGDKDKERKWEESGDQGKGWEWDTGKKIKK